MYCPTTKEECKQHPLQCNTMCHLHRIKVQEERPIGSYSVNKSIEMHKEQDAVAFHPQCKVCGMDLNQKTQITTCGNITTGVLSPYGGVKTEGKVDCPYGLQLKDSSHSTKDESFTWDDMKKAFEQGVNCDNIATCPLDMIDGSLTDYHLSIRQMHKSNTFVKEYSTDIIIK